MENPSGASMRMYGPGSVRSKSSPTMCWMLSSISLSTKTPLFGALLRRHSEASKTVEELFSHHHRQLNQPRLRIVAFKGGIGHFHVTRWQHFFGNLAQASASYSSTMHH